MNVRAVSTVAVVALLVFVLTREVMAGQRDPYAPNNWRYMPGYTPGTGFYA